MILASSLALALAACDNDPAKGKSQAQVAEAVTVAPTAAAPAAQATYSFSNADSKVGFVGAKVTGKHEGSFSAFTGAVTLVDADPTKSSVTATVQMDSLSTEDAKLTGHLKSPDFFDVGRFPTAKFTSTSVKAGGEGGATHTITGNLELHGVTKSISFPATIKASASEVDVHSEFAINRKDFGVVFPGKPDDLIKDEILLKLRVVAKKAG